jgi:hypothetical protein
LALVPIGAPTGLHTGACGLTIDKPNAQDSRHWNGLVSSPTLHALLTRLVHYHNDVQAFTLLPIPPLDSPRLRYCASDRWRDLHDTLDLVRLIVYNA